MQYLPKHPRRHDIQKQQPKHHLCSTSPWLISWQLQTWLTLTAVTQASGLQGNFVHPLQSVSGHMSHQQGLSYAFAACLGSFQLPGERVFITAEILLGSANLIASCHAERSGPVMGRMQQAVARTQKHHIVTIQAVDLKTQGTAHCYLKCMWPPLCGIGIYGTCYFCK